MSSEFEQGGTTANRHGKVLEDLVRSVAKTYKYTELSYAKWKKQGEPVGCLVACIPYKSIYGTRSTTEFMFVIRSGRSIRVECKWQQVSGSVDEKYPYLFENMKSVDEPEVIILLDGGGYKDGAHNWLRDSCTAYQGKKISLLDMTGFTIWANKNLRHDGSDCVPFIRKNDPDMDNEWFE